MTLRQRGIAKCEERNHRIPRNRADSASRDEGGRMLDRQNDVGRAGSRRKGCDQCSDKRPATATDAVTTIAAVSAILSTSSYQNSTSGGMRSYGAGSLPHIHARFNFTSIGGPLLMV